MGRGPKKMTEALIAQWQKEGRGKGEGPKYKPWLEVFDFSSIGRVERTESARFGRTIHLMSDVERDTFYAAEYSQRVLDAREQYPLDREITLEIAKYLNIRHPYYPGTDVPTVMTVDLFCKVVRNGVPGYEAIDCKRTEAAEDTHAIEKLQITRTYFAGMDVPHRLVFHSRLPKTHIRNIEWMRSGLIKSGEQERYPGYFREKSRIMAHELANSTRNMPLNEYCANFEIRHGMSPAEGLRVAKLLMYERTLLCDLTNPDLATAPLSTFRCSAPAGVLDAAGGS
ncbi:TnsA endonuclease C-terminal domain-containing protein [Paraburkholderia azotifigens]|uniref:Heteromeric transposase endonuclease subunit TnsA n=1 Tax=Paraburkholderia azotifigens TaxID=2057004 RepID=A0A5C6V706_9BURK|nr:TnsA endonuclease C-terminal domain-containing protein [Paraburkholderia azotifigens]TXC81032.1 heteromeric transposase endonuclease subunit TnsA [Paraburkholderia azotifigens]